jgi:hypothetical protein
MTEGDKIKLPRKEHPNLPNHLCDALLYAWRYTYQYMSEPAADKIIVGSRQWYEAQAKDIWEREREQLEERQASLWPDDSSGFSQ